MNKTFLRWIPLLLGMTLLAACGRLDLGYGPLLYDVRVQPEAISPNADGDTDATEIRYSLRRSADVSIYFENEDGERFYFRKGERRSPGDYSVLWGGVVDEPQTVMIPRAGRWRFSAVWCPTASIVG